MRLLWLWLAVAVAILGCVPEWVAENRTANDLFRQGRLEEALARYEAVSAGHPSLEASYNAGTALASLRRDQDALRRLDSALGGASAVVDAAAHYNRGIVLFRLGDCARARQAFAAALRLVVDDQDAGFNLEVVERELSRGPDQPGGACRQERAAGDQSGASEGEGDDGEEMVAGQEGSQTNAQDPLAATSDRMRELLAQLQRGTGNRATELNTDHPNMSLEEALRLIEEVHGRQGGFEQLVRGSSGVIQP